MIDVDPVLFRRVIDNLLENAHKYTPDVATPIELRVARHGDDIVFEIADSGIGIPTAICRTCSTRSSAAIAAGRARPAASGSGLRSRDGSRSRTVADLARERARPRDRRAAQRAGRSRGYAAIGSVIVTVVPLPGSLSIASRPPAVPIRR